jgi:hypothetical protein
MSTQQPAGSTDQHQTRQQQQRPLQCKTFISALKTKVKKGESRAHFTLRMPRIGGQDKLNVSMAATVQSLTALVDHATILYGLELVVRRPSNAYAWVMEKPFDDGVLTSSVARRLKEQAGKAKTRLNLTPSLPTLLWDDKTNPQKPCFVAKIPKGTALYSTWPYFWEIMGFEKGVEMVPDVTILSRPSTTVLVAYGFWNNTDVDVVSRGETIYDNISFSDLMLQLDDVEPPAVVQLQLETLSETRATVVSPREVETDPATASKVLMSLLQDASLLCNLITNNLFLVTIAEDGGAIELTNTEQTYSSATFEINFNAETAVLFKRTTIRMDANESLEWELKTSTSKEGEPRDAFEGKYPVMLLLEGCGQASHYVEGRGYCATLGTLHEKPQSVNAQTVYFETDMIGIQLECADSKYDTISFPENTTFTMILRLTPVV